MERRESVESVCPRCGNAFMCQPDDIANCQCSRIKLSAETLEEISSKYAGCLCLHCLKQMEAATMKSQINPLE